MDHRRSQKPPCTCSKSCHSPKQTSEKNQRNNDKKVNPKPLYCSDSFLPAPNINSSPFKSLHSVFKTETNEKTITTFDKKSKTLKISQTMKQKQNLVMMPPKQQQQQHFLKDRIEEIKKPALEPSAPPLTPALQPILLSPPPQYKSILSLANHFEKTDRLPSSSKHQQPAPSSAHHRQASPMQKSMQFLAQGGTLTTSSQPKLSPPTSAEKLALLSKYFSGSRPPPTPPELLSPATTEQKSVIMAKYFASGRPPPPPPNQSLPPFFLQSPPPPLPPLPQLTVELMNKFFPIQYYSTNQCPLCMQEVAEILKKSKY